MRMVDPSTRDRIARGYIAGEQDPTGAKPGEWVAVESPSRKHRRSVEYQRTNKKLWSKVARKLRGQARRMGCSRKSKSKTQTISGVSTHKQKAMVQSGQKTSWPSPENGLQSKVQVENTDDQWSIN